MKWLYVAGILLFQGGSALCGGAPNMGALIFGRVIAGAGGTGIYLGGLNYFSAMITSKERVAYLAGTGFAWALGAILGPVIGGGFSDSSAIWRRGFYINLIIGAITAPVYLAGMGATFAIGFIFAGGIWQWSDGRTIAMIVVLGVITALYAIQLCFCVLFYITTTCANTCMFFTAFYIPIYFQFTQNDTSPMAAVRLLPYLLFTITFDLASGWTLPKIKYYMPLCLTRVAQIYGFSILMGVRTGITMQLGAINLQNVAQIGAIVICLVIASQAFQSNAVDNLSQVLDGQGFSQADIHGAVAGVQSTLFEKLNGDLQTVAIVAITSAMARAFVIPLVAGAVGSISSLLMSRERLFG
ncbi:hypothetical protein N7526_008373 [Penicillium atrosanguineum]|nr:hypothetical protein N7526_008373 [Penicillium atrosanguineum]